MKPEKRGEGMEWGGTGEEEREAGGVSVRQLRIERWSG